MSTPKYKNIGKKQIITAFNGLANKTEAIEMTLNLLIMMLEDKKVMTTEEFNEFMKNKLGGKDGVPTDENSDGDGDTTTNNKD